MWELLVNARNATVNNFELTLNEFKRELLEGYNNEDQMDYLRNLKKPGKMEPSQFLLKLRAANRMATQLPNVPEDEEGFSDQQLRRVFLSAMPRTWQDNFENASLTIYNSTLQEIRTYMDRQSVKDPYVPRAKPHEGGAHGNAQGRNDRNHRRGGQQGRGGQGNRNGNGNNRNGNQTNVNAGANRSTGNRTGNRIQNGDPCPLPGHGNHTWGQCRANRFNDDARNGQGNQANTGNNNQGHRYNTRSQNRPNQGQNHNVQGTNNQPRQGNNQGTNGGNPQQGETNVTQGQSFATEAAQGFTFDTIDSFFNHMDDLEVERYEGTTNVLNNRKDSESKIFENEEDITATYNEDLIPTSYLSNCQADQSGTRSFRLPIAARSWRLACDVAAPLFTCRV